MKRLMISGLVSASLLAVATGALRSHSQSGGGTAGMTSRDSASVTQTSQLPAQDFDDRSLVFPRDVRQ